MVLCDYIIVSSNRIVGEMETEYPIRPPPPKPLDVLKLKYGGALRGEANEELQKVAPSIVSANLTFPPMLL